MEMIAHDYAAADYAARYRWFVFPLEARGKRPITAHGFKDATTAAETIAEWWEAYPEANIGLDCGRSGLVVIDLDGQEGVTNWNALQDQLHIPEHKTAIARTGSGHGAHVYYRAPAGVDIRNSAGKLAKGIDVRAQGGYVVLPPSVTEQPYEWEISPDEIAPLPDELQRLLTQLDNKLAPTNGNGNGAHADAFTRAAMPHDAYVQAAITGEIAKLRAAQNGNRNHTLNQAAFALGQLGLSQSELENLLMPIALDCGLTEKESRATIASGHNAGAAQLRAIPQPNYPNGNGAANSGAHANFEHPYLIQNGRICRRRHTNNGEIIDPLCNFTAEITAEVARDDGADVTRLLTIEGKHADGYGLPVARVDASQFASFKWLAPSFGTRAIVNAGQSAQDHLRAAIQHLSTNVQAQHVYTHTGWREIDGRRVFLTATGAPGLDSARVELEKELCRYALPLQPTDSRAAMQASLRFLQIAPLRVTLPLWAAMYLAPLASFLTLDFVLWLYGITGVMKSTAAALALSHYGDFERKDLISWGNTANHIEKITFFTKDVPIVLDDFAPQSDSVAARNLESVVSRIVRGVGNQSGRGRLRSDLSLRPTYRPRGLVISTGEQLPDGQSLVARLVTVEFERGDVDVDKLNEAQDEREQYPHAIAGYVQWLAARWDTLQTEIPNAWKTTRTRAHRAGQHLRLPEAIASLFVGLDLALQYAVEIGAITENDAHDLLKTGWDALTETSERQAQLTAEERPTRRFLSVLGELLAQGTARVTTLTTLPAQNAGGGGADFLGWSDQDYLYLLPSETYRRVSEFVRQQGRHFGVKESALRKALAEENLIETETGSDGKTHLTVRCSASGNGRVLKVRRTEFEKVVGVSP